MCSPQKLSVVQKRLSIKAKFVSGGHKDVINCVLDKEGAIFGDCINKILLDLMPKDIDVMILASNIFEFADEISLLDSDVDLTAGADGDIFADALSAAETRLTSPIAVWEAVAAKVGAAKAA